MSSVGNLISQGGALMVALIALSLVLYYHCLNLLTSQYRLRKRLQLPNQHPLSTEDGSTSPISLENEIQDRFAQSLRPITALIAAAPLLGLLGTVIGMIDTFNSLSTEMGGKSMEGLSQGISLALVTTETGLAIALPAMVLTHLARRQMQFALYFVAQSGDAV